MTKTEEKLNFGADVSRLLDIVAHALYSNRDIFLRELISNASDACDKLRYEAIASPDLVKNDPEFKIRVFKNTDDRTLNIVDNGIGMTREELIDNLGTIAKSGTAAMMKKISDGGTQKEKMSLIGQFGVGFYASFMVANKVTVISRRAGDKQAWLWESDGKTGFTVREATKKEAKALMEGRGTAIILHLDDEASDFLIDEKIRQVVETYSDHIDFPIFMNQEQEENEKPVNSVTALWVRPKDDITEEQHTEFFRHIGFGVDEPLLTSHWRAEGKIEYTALLYVPTMRPMNLFDPGRKTSVRLYVKRVFITDECEGLVYPWLRFLRGVVDSEDLPLNISREMLQHNPLIDKIRNGLAKRILGDLNKLADSDPLSYGMFWGQFGAVLKEGLYDAFEHREALLKVVRFYSTHEERTLTSLSDYVSRMKEGQEIIYYISGENLETLKNSPQIEGFRARGIEVLFLTDTIDDFWLQTVLDYDGKPFQSVTKGNIDLDRFETEKDEEKKDHKDESEESSIGELRALIAETLKEEIGEVRISKRLTSSPVCLVAADNEVDLRMERVLRVHQKYESTSKRVLEINPDHTLIKRLAAMMDNKARNTELADAAWLLLDQARIIQGEPIPDPAGFTKRMSNFMERGLAA
ncbi:MAG: molecular chaperone HtpG [Alphaproteobacteria bacterium CG_4_9_14_3_um_filter_47_13]|nr:MAG: molecular chaperone HtpG [Alphaproteobacteria bacterium CG_4_9_14_3_um_filter_47_13]